jgi:hypothetical protein
LFQDIKALKKFFKKGVDILLKGVYNALIKFYIRKTMKRRVSAGCGHRDFPVAERETNRSR